MEIINSREIRLKALDFIQKGITWHFHILTPTCVFNEKKKYAFILESADNSFVYYSEEKPGELGMELAPLMHDANVLNQSTTDSGYQPSEVVRRMIDRAVQLNEQGIEWHHHVLPRSCKFNEDPANFTLIFEDPEKEVIKQSSEIEPINDLKQIEHLFYS